MATTLTQSQPARIESIDLVRGLVMVIMALDHVRDYFHHGAMAGDPTDLATTTPLLFFTRWITHFCAPIFVLLAGSSAFLYGNKNGSKALSGFLFTRGLWLVFLELTVVRLGWTFNPTFTSPFMLQVIWAIGWSMVALSILVWLPRQAVFALGLALVLGHNLLDSVHADGNNRPLYLLWAIWHEPSPFALGPAHFFSLYPLLPWIGVMCCGYALGALYVPGYPAVTRRKILLYGGLAVMLFFIVLRAINRYGNPEPWTVQHSFTYTLLSFLNTEKYPPSALFLCMTLGPALWILLTAEHVHGFVARFFVTIGRVPLFYYILHLYLAHGAALLTFLCMGGHWADIDYSQNPFNGIPDTFGFSLGWVYVAWLCIVAVLYPLCRAYGNLKRRSRWKGWSYL